MQLPGQEGQRSRGDGSCRHQSAGHPPPPAQARRLQQGAAPQPDRQQEQDGPGQKGQPSARPAPPQKQTLAQHAQPPPWSGASGSKAASPQACVSSRVYHIIVLCYLKTHTLGRPVGRSEPHLKAEPPGLQPAHKAAVVAPPPLSRASRRPRAPSPTAPPPWKPVRRLRAHG